MPTNALNLPLLTGGVGGYVPHNEALMTLDVVSGGGIIAKQNAQPSGPASWDAYIIGASPTGTTWVGHAGEFAYFHNGTWYFVEPKLGMRLYSKNDGLWFVYTGTAWTLMPASVYSGSLTSGDQTTTSATFAAVPFATSDLSPVAAVTHPHLADNALVKVETSGTYRLDLSCEIQTVTLMSLIELAFGVNSTTVASGGSERLHTCIVSENSTISLSHVVILAAGDYVCALFRRAAGTGTCRVNNNRARLSVTKIA